MIKQTSDQIRYIAGIFANLRDSMPAGYKCQLTFSALDSVYITVYNSRTWQTVFKHSWEDGDNEASFEAALEARMQQHPEIFASKN